jgi:hypothetical protein
MRLLGPQKDLTMYSDETYFTLRNCRLLENGEYEGVQFVRCIPFGVRKGQKETFTSETTAIANRVVAEVKDPGVKVCWHHDFGDYVRVETDSKTYSLICQMKS